MSSLTRFIFSITILLFSCTSRNDSIVESQVEDEKNAESAEVIINSPDSSIHKLFEYFENFVFDSLHIFSPNEKIGGKKYEGKLIDKSYYELFGTNLSNRLISYYTNSDSTFYNGHYIYANYKFKLRDGRVGLIIRTISQYSETSVELWVYNEQNDSLSKLIDLEDSFGDGMWFFVTDAWLLDLDNDGNIDVVKHKKEWWEDDVDPTENNPHGIGEDHKSSEFEVYLAKGEIFVQTSMKIDTSNYKLYNWIK